MQFPKFLEGFVTINFNFNDNKKIEILRGKENQGKFEISNLNRKKPDYTEGRTLPAIRKNKKN